MPEPTTDHDVAMREIADAYPEYFVTTGDQVRAMADDYGRADGTVAYPDRPGRSDQQGAQHG